MQLKRIYDFTGKEPVLDHVKVLSSSKVQKFTPNFINKAVEENLVTLGKGQIKLHTKPELTYNIVTSPGYYCCHDNKKCGGEKDAAQYVAERFKGKSSPDKNNPAGYRKDNFYTCELGA